ncbi:MAG: hypothetical protein U1D30_03715 [Planctomycetota bacterium]
MSMGSVGGIGRSRGRKTKSISSIFLSLSPTAWDVDTSFLILDCMNNSEKCSEGFRSILGILFNKDRAERNRVRSMETVNVSTVTKVVATTAERLRDWRGEIVVVDCKSPFVIVGTLAEATDHYLELRRADFHDLRDTGTSRELYVVKTARHGVAHNRALLVVQMSEIIGISRLADVVVE